MAATCMILPYYASNMMFELHGVCPLGMMAFVKRWLRSEKKSNINIRVAFFIEFLFVVSSQEARVILFLEC